MNIVFYYYILIYIEYNILQLVDLMPEGILYQFYNLISYLLFIFSNFKPFFLCSGREAILTVFISVFE